MYTRELGPHSDRKSSSFCLPWQLYCTLHCNCIPFFWPAVVQPHLLPRTSLDELISPGNCASAVCCNCAIIALTRSLRSRLSELYLPLIVSERALSQIVPVGRGLFTSNWGHYHLIYHYLFVMRAGDHPIFSRSTSTTCITKPDRWGQASVSRRRDSARRRLSTNSPSYPFEVLIRIQQISSTPDQFTVEQVFNFVVKICKIKRAKKRLWEACLWYFRRKKIRFSLIFEF